MRRASLSTLCAAPLCQRHEHTRLSQPPARRAPPSTCPALRLVMSDVITRSSHTGWVQATPQNAQTLDYIWVRGQRPGCLSKSLAKLPFQGARF